MMSQRRRLSSQRIPHAQHSPEIVPVVEERRHLEFDRDDVLRCKKCRSSITIDPRTHVEYGHARLYEQ